MNPFVTDIIAWSVCRSVCHDRELCKKRWTDSDAVWVVDLGGPLEACVRWGVHIVAIWRIRLNRPCAATKWPFC